MSVLGASTQPSSVNVDDDIGAHLDCQDVMIN